jgi:hypothetical protein
MKIHQLVKNGTLHQYVAKRRSKAGVITAYPKINGDRNPNTIKHWFWKLSYKITENGEVQSRSISIPHKKVPSVRQAIVRNLGLEAIIALIHS